MLGRQGAHDHRDRDIAVSDSETDACAAPAESSRAAGIGAFRTPPVWLQPGDHLALSIAGLGTLEHWIVAT